MNIIALLLPYLSLAAGLAALIICGNWLVTGGVQLARHFKISTLIVGLTIVSFGTSAPEIFVSIEAAIIGSPDIALGNVIGSNIANIALVIGLTSIIYPILIRNKSVFRDLSILLIITILLFCLGYNGIIGRIEGICLVSVFAAYIARSIIKEKRNDSQSADEINTASIKPLPATLLVIASIIGLYFGSELFVNGARGIAVVWGVSEHVIGVSVVALGTSMPELVTSVVAALKKEMDISIGNIIGSNILNITCALGIASIIKPLAVNPETFIKDMIWVFGAAVFLLLAMLPISNGKISRWKGVIFLVLYISYIYTLYGM